MNELLKTLLPYVVCFILGVIVCLSFRGCGKGKTETVTITKPIPTVKYIDRWRTDTVRFVSKQIITRTDTIYQNKIINRLDTLLLIDTVKIVETFLSEVAEYDTTIQDIRLRWQNYQNRTENMQVDQIAKIRDSRFAIGVHANAGLLSDFESSYVPLFGLGLQGTIKKTYISANYGFNGRHYVGVGVGYNFINR